MTEREWPALPYDDWRATRDTLHMYTQVLGKLRLALSPFEPEWANVALYVTARGLTTSPLPTGARALDAELDLVDHVLVLRTSDGRVERRPLGGAVADFHRDVMDALRRMEIDVRISPVPSEVAHPIPFPEDRAHATYEPDKVSRFQRVLSAVDLVLKEHRAGFSGRTTPVHFFWGTFDLALTRYSGRPSTPVAGAGFIMRFSEDAEEICAGWWPGDESHPEAAFYAYAYPAPAGIGQIPIEPRDAAWSESAGLFLLPYEAVRSTADPRRAILDFLRSTYTGASRLAGWSDDLTHVNAPADASGAGARRRTRHE